MRNTGNGDNDIFDGLICAVALEYPGNLFADFPETFDFNLAAGDEFGPGLPFHTYTANDLRFLCHDLGLVAVNLQKQGGADAFGWKGLLQEFNRAGKTEPVHELDRAGNERTGGDNRRYDIDGRGHVLEKGQYGRTGGRARQQTDENLGENPQGAFGTDHEMEQIVAGDILDAFPAELDDIPDWGDHLQTVNVTSRDPVFDGPTPPAFSATLPPTKQNASLMG